MALEFYKPYRPLSFTVLFAQGLRGAVLAIILLPFQETIVKGNYGSLVLFGALWGPWSFRIFRAIAWFNRRFNLYRNHFNGTFYGTYGIGSSNYTFYKVISLLGT